MIEDIFKESPMVLYEFLLLNPLTILYTERKKTTLNEWQNYSNLLIDKFAIHSGSFFHLSEGLIEHNNSTEERKVFGYDLFTVNSTFRAIMETYATFYHIYVEPASEEEREFKFLLWKIDGLCEKKRFIINESDFEGVKEILIKDRELLCKTTKQFETCSFYKKISDTELEKIYNTSKNRYKWRFTYINEVIKPFTITELVTHTFKRRGFINLYKYTSIHIHSNYYSIEDFEKHRGKEVSREYTDPLIRMAILTTLLIMDDISRMDKNVEQVFNSFTPELKNFIRGMSQTIRSSNND